MPLYTHKGGERVLVPADTHEGRRLEADDSWSREDEPTPEPDRGRRRSTRHRPAVHELEPSTDTTEEQAPAGDTADQDATASVDGEGS